MLADRLNLLLNSELNQRDLSLSIAGMSWDDYDKLTDEEYSGYRVSYLNGVVTIVSPSQNHETIAEVINYLVIAYCRQYKLLYFPMRSTTLRKPPLVGKEPDVSFAFNTRKSLPDLAIEVVYSSGGISDLAKYKQLGILEVWFWQDNELKFYWLVNSNYEEMPKSRHLGNLSSQMLVKFINRGLTESPLTIEADFVSELNRLEDELNN